MKVYIGQIKPTLGNVEKNLNMMLEVIDKAIAEKNDIVVFPELSLTGYSMEDIVFDVAIKEVPNVLLEKSKEISIVFGAVELGEEEYPYNTAYYLEDGKVVHKHRKVYLPTYGVYQEGRNFMAGNKFRAFDSKFGRMGILICEDVWHQSPQYLLAQDGAKYVFILFNSPAVVGKRKEELSEGWKTIVKANSLLNGVYSVAVNRVGVEDGTTFFGNSFVVDPNGQIVAEGKYLNEDGFVCELDENVLRRARFKAPMFKTENLNLTKKEIERIENKRFQ
ncbi:nitrilase-related carbon-nitrogen hydrolase [uncultured Fusobacterium sp.]|uniref:nitrilase-related carbon-nitrogen hydrolase n=1 Tax=uncultured Fusobacterium sp. TaxID=159267 RepID=UPI0025D5DDEA|nr:nitrilase-related carbon-nitrogen hydrolase [uncultured Fusobacterium sp.]